MRWLMVVALVGVGCHRKQVSDAYYDFDDVAMAMPRAEMGATDSPPERLEASSARMVYRSGHALLTHPRPPEILGKVEALAVEAGGFVESAGGRQATVRVPVEGFESVFQAVLGLAPVADKSLTARDVTSAFAETELRLKAARQTLARLQELLAQASEESDKIELLQQIRRLTQDIDSMERRSRALRGLAELARITVEVDTGARELVERATPAGMEWIDGLSPFEAGSLLEGRPLRLPEPSGFVQIDPKGTLDAESADGATLRGGRMVNEPVGSTRFWADAVAERFAPEFEGVERDEQGGFTVLTFVEPAERSWRWSIAVRASGRWVDAVVVHYPSEGHHQRYSDSVASILSGGGA